MTRTLHLWLILVATVSCGNLTDSEEDDIARLIEMREEILAMIADPICQSIEECRVIAFGTKACGGPATYLVYSVAVTDSAHLTRLVEQYNSFDEELNRKYRKRSTCESPRVPELAVVDGRCVGNTD
jgi:hypothetical protein